MSEPQDPASSAPAAKVHDPRLDASGDDHPGVQPLKFDLIALEKTRYGLQGIGFALLALLIAAPLASRHFAGTPAWKIAGLVIWGLGLLCMTVSVAITSPTPHGPLPRYAIRLYVFLCILAMTSTIVHLFHLFTARVESDSTSFIAGQIDNITLISVLALSLIFWRFCQFRGLSGRAIVWLWLCMAMFAAGSANSLGWHPALWVFPPLGLIALFAAWQTARDVWLDAVYRHSKFFVITNPKADVVPLHSAERH
ncbi:MAG TPA: hypothetical protein VK843_16430 [Planctomycetota bacterium]|nr:hypothetical protein [Planctomycetota bacterium]